MNNNLKVGVCSRSFSLNTQLKNELNLIFSNVKYNENGVKLYGENLVDFLSDCDLAITALEKIDDFVLSRLDNLKLISKYGVGTDMIDFDALKKYGIEFYWEGGVNKRSVAELTLTFALLMIRSIPIMNKNLMIGEWRQNKGNLLTGKTIGIIGCGNIGKELVNLLQPFKCNILVYDIIDYHEFYKINNLNKVELEYLLSNSDIISIHLPLTADTNNLLNKDKLQLLKSNSILINTARGGIVNEAYLKYMLINNKILGAAFDVFYEEPNNDLELLNLDNFFATPHIGGSSDEAILAMGRSAIIGLKNYIKNND